MQFDYQYYADGSLRFAHDLADERFDRAYSYDEMGRVKEAYSGSEARDFINQRQTPSASGPYRQTYSYNVWGEMTARQNRYWNKWDSFGASYVNGRNTDPLWEYNADGRLKQDKDLSYKYDAAGSNTEVRQLDNTVINSQLADADGQVSKRVEQNLNVSPAVVTTYYVRSTVLDGRVIAEVNSAGQKQKRNIYLGTEVLASEGVGGSITWKHEDALTGSSGVSVAGGGYSPVAQYDASGVNVGLAAPSGGPLFEAEMPTLIDSPGGAGGMRCTVDGLVMDCGWAGILQSNGAAAQCPNNDCGPQVLRDDKGHAVGWKLFMGSGYWASNGSESFLGFYDEVEFRDPTDPESWAMSFQAHNGRHLVTGISYTAPLGVEATSPVSYSYDEAGNRTGMTDGLGAASYAYDRLSRLTSESRTFNGVGIFSLSYAYNLAGELTSLTDPFQATVSYTLDHIGRIISVTGNGFGAVSLFASDLRYRAWGALKHLTYGNQFSLDQTFTSRLQLLRSELRGAGQFGPSIAMGVENQYYDDGRIRFARDLRSSADHLNFDRAYEYDHVGRMSRALTGTEARGEGASDSNPYRQVYSWDVWDNLVGRNDRHWERSYSFTDTYVNNKRVGWQYDAEGNLTEDEWTRRYDSASREIEETKTGQSVKQSYDGNGEVIKRVENGVTTYYVRSSIIDKVVTELNGSGQRKSTFVYLEGQMMGRYSGGVVWWEHYNPVTQSAMESNSSGAVNWLSERDPLGGDAGLFSPYEGAGLPQFSFEYYYSPDDVGLGNPTNPRAGCNFNGMTLPCNVVAKMASNDAARPDTSQPQGSGPLGLGGITWQQTIFIRGDRPHTGEAYLGNGYEPLMSPNVEFFQQPTPRDSTRMTKEQIDKIRTDIKTLLKKPQCTDFMKKLLDRLGAITGREAYSTDPIEIFEAILQQTGGGGLFLGSKASGHAFGSLELGTATIAFRHINTTNDSAWMNGDIGLHEIAHAGSKKGWGYDHTAMAQAAYDVSQAMNMIQNLGKRPPNNPAGGNSEEWKQRDREASNYFETRLFYACRR
ncbi:MAG TPA: hypothetical protein VF544_09635 [Pyrinomonadaceae bacterium]|jgi:YD repeat-containing protein